MLKKIMPYFFDEDAHEPLFTINLVDHDMVCLFPNSG